MTDLVLDIDNLVVGLGRPQGRASSTASRCRCAKRETLCLVGESGSGKSVTSLTVMGLLQKGALVPSGGSIKLVGEELLTASDRRLRQLRATTHGDDLPGADDGAQSGGAGRPPDRRGAARPYRSRRPRAAQAHPRHDGAGAAARGRAHLRLLPAPPLRRPAPAHHDRDGAGARTETPDRGRADHRARRHHAEADPDPDPRPAARSRHRGAVHHPRHGRGRGDRRPRRGDAQRPAGRDRHARHHPAHARRWNTPATCSRRCRAWCRARRAPRRTEPVVLEANELGKVYRERSLLRQARARSPPPRTSR